MRVFRLAVLFFLITGVSYAQGGIDFKELSLDEALSLAKKENKKLFIDTYTATCKPCKKMELEFRNPDLAEYFNENFINVKVNMNGPLANAYNSKYRVTFLPTLFIVTAEGFATLRIEHLISASDLLSFGKQTNQH